QMIAALSLAGLVLAYLMFASPGKASLAPGANRPSANESVKLVGERLLQIQSGHVIEQKMQIATIERRRINFPVLTVTGSVAASMRVTSSSTSANWQFSSPDALTTFTDWQRARNDIVFTESRLATIRELVEAKVKYQKKYETDLATSAAKGATPEHTVNKARLDTLEAQLDGQKDIYEAENAVRLAKRSEASLALQLEQTGLEPDLLLAGTPEMDIVMADVPLGSLSYVRVGQQCKA